MQFLQDIKPNVLATLGQLMLLLALFLMILLLMLPRWFDHALAVVVFDNVDVCCNLGGQSVLLLLLLMLLLVLLHKWFKHAAVVVDDVVLVLRAFCCCSR